MSCASPFIRPSDGLPVAYEYDALNNRTKETYSGGDVKDYVYDAKYQLKEIKLNGQITDKLCNMGTCAIWGRATFCTFLHHSTPATFCAIWGRATFCTFSYYSTTKMCKIRHVPILHGNSCEYIRIYTLGRNSQREREC